MLVMAVHRPGSRHVLLIIKGGCVVCRLMVCTPFSDGMAELLLYSPFASKWTALLAWVVLLYEHRPLHTTAR